MSFRVIFERNAGPITSIPQLCDVLDITQIELSDALALPQIDRYKQSTVLKRDGSARYIYNPQFLIRKIQRRINTRLFNPKPSSAGHKGQIILWPSYIFGCVPNEPSINGSDPVVKDYIACAKTHCLSKSILKMDISNFFDNVHIDLVQGIFRDLLEYSDDVSNALADICCHNDSLVQGGLTSSYLACLALYDVEPKLVRRLMKKGLRYTRLIDDITVSSKIDNQNFDFAEDIIVQMLHEKNLPVNRDKTERNYSSSKPLMVHGLRVNFKNPRLPSDEVARIRANVHNVEKLAKERHYRTIHPYRRDYNRCLGRVSKLSRIGHKEHIKLMKRLKAIKPLPSKQDIVRCENMIRKLESDYQNGKNDTFTYWRRYNLANQRITIINRTFKKQAAELREKLASVKSSYEK